MLILREIEYIHTILWKDFAELVDLLKLFHIVSLLAFQRFHVDSNVSIIFQLF